MSSTFPDAETVRAALALAVRAPSVHNSQPWRWEVGTDRLRLYADMTRLGAPPARGGLVATDPDRRDLLLSCGATLHHCVIALAASGWRATVQRLPDPADPDLLATLTLTPFSPSDVETSLAEAIPRRRTDRRHYSGREVSPADIALMGARAARVGVTMRRVESLDDLNVVAAEAVFQHELTRWSGRYGAAAGVPARNTPSSDPAAVVPGRFFAGPVLAQPPSAGAVADHAVVLALGTRDDDAMARLRAGEATSLVLLTATALGMATCPITEPLEFTDTRAALRDELFDAREYPQMLVRVDWAADDAAPPPATPRR
ncbi:Acg family FMN-binding oxidoreductase [Mycolicibacterium mageritense]|uniref:Acg family FMN-binding oxidoreductase n=1 Tax=Mycolicibacterium mageritense TaxID=53462 RepID=UPI001E60B7B1|nr:NAD(P)H nitroreductase [Mycolicibacterium mageritense]GJJ17108.1 NAD(P)H nitroreductase [Mycolicibacterium mageritense]